MTKPTIAGIKRLLTPGIRVRITNHFRPVASRDTRVHAKTNTVDLCTWAIDSSGEFVASHTLWPKAKQLRGDDDPNVFHFDAVDGAPFLTIEVIGHDHPDAADWPAQSRVHDS